MVRVNSLAGRAPVVLASLVAACIGVSCGRISSGRVEVGRQCAASFLEEIRAGRTDPAWQATTVEFKSLMGAESLRDYTRTNPALRGPAEYTDSRPIESGGGRLIEYRFRATPPIGKKTKQPPLPRTVRVMVSFDDDPPKVERLTVE